MAHKKRKFSLRKLVYNDKYLIVVSIIAAVIIWISVALNLSPTTTKKITVPVDISFSGTLAEQLGIEYYGNSQISVDVTISCKKYLAKDITADDITAYLKTSSVTSAGYHSVPIFVAPKDGSEFTVQSYYPTSAEGFYDVSQEVIMPVDVEFTNKDFAANGYVAGETTLNEPNVTVKGPATYIANVDRVVANIELASDLIESQVVTLDPIAVDSNNKRVNYVTVSGKEQGIFATVPILKIGNLPPSVNFINAPKNVNDIVTVEYSKDLINVGVLESAGLSNLVLGDIDFTNVKEGKNEFTFDVSKISGIAVLDGTTDVTVTITVPENFKSKTLTISRSNITLDALDKYNVRILSLSSYNITLMGEEKELENISKSNLSVTLAPVDGGTLSTESNLCNLVISIKDADSTWVLGKYTAKVKVTEKTQ